MTKPTTKPKTISVMAAPKPYPMKFGPKPRVRPTLATQRGAQIAKKATK
jgi:hypothetical protein